jgi:hypothetical protein
MHLSFIYPYNNSFLIPSVGLFPSYDGLDPIFYTEEGSIPKQEYIRKDFYYEGPVKLTVQFFRLQLIPDPDSPSYRSPAVYWRVTSCMPYPFLNGSLLISDQKTFNVFSNLTRCEPIRSPWSIKADFKRVDPSVIDSVYMPYEIYFTLAK